MTNCKWTQLLFFSVSLFCRLSFCLFAHSFTFPFFPSFFLLFTLYITLFLSNNLSFAPMDSLQIWPIGTCTQARTLYCVEKHGIYTYITAPERSYLSIRISINLAQSQTIYSQYDSVLVKSLLAPHITPFSLSLSHTHTISLYSLPFLSTS